MQIKMCERNVLTSFRAHSSIPYSEAFILKEILGDRGAEKIKRREFQLHPRIAESEAWFFFN